MEEKCKGKLKWFSDVKGYGFITAGSEDYFVHHSSIRNSEELKEGDEVEFGIRQTDRGFQATNVTKIKE